MEKSKNKQDMYLLKKDLNSFRSFAVSKGYQTYLYDNQLAKNLLLLAYKEYVSNAIGVDENIDFDKIAGFLLLDIENKTILHFFLEERLEEVDGDETEVLIMSNYEIFQTKKTNKQRLKSSMFTLKKLFLAWAQENH